MGWEDRGNRSYYYRKRREGDRVVSEYVGAGAVAELVAMAAELERESTELERRDLATEIDADLEMVHAIDAACQLTRALTAAALLSAGYHTHKGQWRKRRDELRAGDGSDSERGIRGQTCFDW